MFREDGATEMEARSYWRLAGEMVWLGCEVLPQASVIGSVMQQKVPFLKVGDLLEGNKMLKEIQDLQPIVVFRKPCDEIQGKVVLTYSDAAFNISSRHSYGQTGLVRGLWMRPKNGSEINHAIDWLSAKQKRITYSSYGA